MNKDSDSKYLAIIGEKILPLVIGAVEDRYESFDVETGLPLTGVQMLADCLIELVEDDRIFIEIIRDKQVVNGEEYYRFAGSHDHDWSSRQEMRDEFAYKLLMGGELRLTPMPSHDDRKEVRE